MTRTKILTAVTAATALTALACIAWAQTSPIEAALSADDAIAIALAEQPGTIAEAELDRYDGKAVYDIEVITDAGQEVEFNIDANTGDILSQWIDDDPGNDPTPGAGDVKGNEGVSR